MQAGRSALNCINARIETVKLPLIALIVTILAGCAVAPPRPTSIARNDYATATTYVSRLIRYEMDESSIAGLSIALVDDQRIIWAAGFGYADRERKIPATADTLYRAGSISKLFTDTAAMQLAEQGRLDIDKPLRGYLPGFSIKTRGPGSVEITARQLMTHHSGLPSDRLKGLLNPHPAPFSGLVSDIRDDYAVYPPNTVYHYSNLAVTLLGAAVQNVSEMPFADYMKQSVLLPLGMSESSFDYGLAASPQMAKGYRGREPETEPPLRVVPAGGLTSSVNDLSRFMSMMFAGGMAGNHRILKPETVAEMLRPQNTAVPLDFSFRVGLGWMLSTSGASAIENAGTVAHHSGGTLLFRSQMYILPDHKLGVVVLSNSSTAGQAINHIATEALKLALEAKTGIRQPEEHNKIQPDDRPIPAETVREYAGDYVTQVGFAQIRACGRGLCAETAGRDFNLVRGSDGLFRLDYRLLGIFHVKLGTLSEIGFSRRTVAGRDVVVARMGHQEMLAGQRIVPPRLTQAWRRRLGDYEITNRDDDVKLVDHIRLIERDGFLLFEVTLAQSPGIKVRPPLMPVSDNEGTVLGLLSDSGESVRVVTVEGEERLLFSGYLLRKVGGRAE
jgi:CubicO group peptidase (beta-lactamase class C family)